jgi:predicted secreted hydrolase
MKITRRHLSAASFGYFALLNNRLNHAAAPLAFYPQVIPLENNRGLEFPKDHGAHPEFRTEWWYVTGWLNDNLGFQVTFFRSRTPHSPDNPSRFAPKQLLIAHAAIASPKNGQLMHEELATRAIDPISTFSDSDCRLSIKQYGHEWLLERLSKKDQQGNEQYRIAISTPQLQINLHLATDKAPWLQGREGFSQKGPFPRQASYYYSRPQLLTEGTVAYRGEKGDKGGNKGGNKGVSETIKVRGTSWFDHEWSSEILAAGAIGWDWLGLNMIDGSALTIFRIRNDIHFYAAWRLPNGEVQSFIPKFEPGRNWTSKRTNATYPITWTITVGPAKLFIEPLLDDQELDGRRSTGTVYWEGAVLVKEASATGKAIGRGYLELTGYHQPVKL